MHKVMYATGKAINNTIKSIACLQNCVVMVTSKSISKTVKSTRRNMAGKEMILFLFCSYYLPEKSERSVRKTLHISLAAQKMRLARVGSLPHNSFSRPSQE